jgi:hypothetical protein
VLFVERWNDNPHRRHWHPRDHCGQRGGNSPEVLANQSAGTQMADFEEGNWVGQKIACCAGQRPGGPASPIMHSESPGRRWHLMAPLQPLPCLDLQATWLLPSYNNCLSLTSSSRNVSTSGQFVATSFEKNIPRDEDRAWRHNVPPHRTKGREFARFEKTTHGCRSAHGASV